MASVAIANDLTEPTPPIEESSSPGENEGDVGEDKDEDEIIGYVDPWIASPGQKVAVKVCRIMKGFGCEWC